MQNYKLWAALLAVNTINLALQLVLLWLRLGGGKA